MIVAVERRSLTTKLQVGPLLSQVDTSRPQSDATNSINKLGSEEGQDLEHDSLTGEELVAG